MSLGLPAARHPGKPPRTGIQRLLPIGIRSPTRRTVFVIVAQRFIHIVHKSGVHKSGPLERPVRCAICSRAQAADSQPFAFFVTATRVTTRR
jgi:hypothetical protein